MMRYTPLHQTLPFTAIVGQHEMKRALILNAINPMIGGVLIRGEKGTAKSTAVRALAALLPQIRITPGCPFSCDPDCPDECCRICQESDAAEVATRPVRIVTLPLGATEDRVIGTLDLKTAIKEGITALDPGLLASAHRGILYIDEVNLLDDHIIDLLLDAAAMGVNIIEREGISISHPSRFILIGTMNPEEGEIRPQLLDRFGLMISVEGMADPEDRMAVIAAVLEWGADPGGAEDRQESACNELRRAILRARETLLQTTVSEDLIRSVVDACIKLGITTHRAEITVIRTAKTIAAFEGRREVTAEDIREAMRLALPHRMRRRPFEEPQLDPEILNEMIPDPPDDEAPGEGNDQGDFEEKSSPGSGASRMAQHGIGSGRDTSRIWRDQAPDRNLRRVGDGKRIETPTEEPRGRRRSTGETDRWEGIAIDATIRSAAPKQAGRERDGNAIVIQDEDLRKVRRRGKAEVACVFVVDASGSMGTEKRMESAKGAVFSLLEDAYINRDRVGLVAFRGTSADLILPLSRSPELALRRLREIPTGGRTPLAAGLQKGFEVLNREMRKKHDIIPIMMLISDGRANAGEGAIRQELGMLSDIIAECGIRTIVIDTEAAENGQSLSLGYCRMIAERTHGSYHAISDLSPGVIESIAREEKGFWTGS
ncbi:magnesium chelatase subunit D family protein [Methanocalculus sp.]|uniref:magnesium chelatase subunit D family protein n=1 Tax=Methanocalculus sp. TaxID=2004547 RepID=UPI002722E432|nr:magnesium chelatase subunit D family protein [Methanocalculus sp.]MDO8841670.1 magnesium chelatase subunit D family protein [Methanocalculus sp.]